MGAFIPTSKIKKNTFKFNERFISLIFWRLENVKVAPEVEENIPPPLELRKRLPDESNTDKLPHISGTQQIINVQQHTRPIGSLPFGQVLPLNYGYRPIHTLLKVCNCKSYYFTNWALQFFSCI